MPGHLRPKPEACISGYLNRFSRFLSYKRPGLFTLREFFAGAYGYKDHRAGA